jgi:hypothetical protein
MRRARARGGDRVAACTIIASSDGQSMSMVRRRHHDGSGSPCSQEADAEPEKVPCCRDRSPCRCRRNAARTVTRVESDLPRHEAGQPRYLGGMGEHVLTIARAALETSHQAMDVGVQVVQPELERNRLPSLRTTRRSLP